MTDRAAGLLTERFDPETMTVEVASALAIVRELQTAWPGLHSWVNFPLLNRSGDSQDLLLQAYEGPARITSYAGRLPMTIRIVRQIADQGFDVSHARVAVLFGRDVLRPHVDMHHSIRLIVPLNEQGTDFRHVFGDFAVAMRAGELWSVNGDVCHGAANISPSGARVALLVDARPHSRPSDWCASWRVPEHRKLRRRSWTQAARRAQHEQFRRIAELHSVEAAEHAWHFTAFEYEVGPKQAYNELIALLQELALEATDPQRATAWRERGEFWSRRNCVCVPGDP